MPRAAALLIVALAADQSPACTFCGDNVRARPTLRMQYAQAKAVLYGHLKNPRIDPRTDEGFTDLAVASALKDDPARGTQNTVTLRGYIPVVGDTPTEYLVFCAVANGRLDAVGGVPAPKAVVEYLQGAAKLDDKDATARLAYFFQHLTSASALVAADAF
ncbi:MAG: hypothetical protein K2V38_10990, partial [Gemmataceae bacterium]|nr:hypothetical protein [Gemmataceae bacterium]